MTTWGNYLFILAVLCLATEHVVTAAQDSGELAIHDQYSKSEASDAFIPQRVRRLLQPHEICYINAWIFGVATTFIITTFTAHVLYPPNAWSIYAGQLVAGLVTGGMAGWNYYRGRNIADRAERQRLAMMADPNRRPYNENVEALRAGHPMADDMLYEDYLEELRAGTNMAAGRTFNEWFRAILEWDGPPAPLYQPQMTPHERRFMPPSYEDAVANQERPVALPTYEQALIASDEDVPPPPPYEQPDPVNERLEAVARLDQQELPTNEEHIILPRPTPPDDGDGLRRRNVPHTDNTE